MANVFRPPADEGTIRAGWAHPGSVEAASGRSGPWILAATILASSMAFIDGTVVSVALPRIQADTGATAVDALWIVESYALMLAALILVGGSLGDHYGRRRVFALGVVIFAGASVWCAVAPGVGQLVAARAVQGVGGALLVPGSLAIISASFSEERRGRAIGTWSGFSGIAAAAGPLLGGYLVENVSWRAAFLLNVPLAIAVLYLIFRHVPESRDPEARRLDAPGAVLATVGLGGLVYGLIEASARGLADPLVLAALVIGSAALLAFVLVERRCPEPMLPLSLFRSRNFAGANLLTLLLYAGLGGALYFLPFNLIQVQGYSATAAGAALLPFVVFSFILSRWAGGLVDRYGAKVPLMIGTSVAALGTAMFALPGVGGSYWTTFFPAVLVQGLGMSLVIAPLTTTAMNSVEGEHSGLASGVNNAVSRTAGLLAVPVLGIFVFAAFSSGLEERLSGVDLPAQARSQLEAEEADLAGAAVPGGLSAEQAAAVETAIRESFVSGFRLAMLVGAGLALAGTATAAFLIGNEGHPRREPPLRTKGDRGAEEGDLVGEEAPA